jgi:hypothetical protein
MNATRRWSWFGAVAVLAGSLSTLASAPASAATSTVTATYEGKVVHQGDVLARYPKIGSTCEVPKTTQQLNLTWKLGSSTPEASAKVNANCELVLTQLGTSPAKDTSPAPLASSGPVGASTATTVAASTCSYSFHGDLAELSSWVTGAEVYEYMTYYYGCGGHGDLYYGNEHHASYYNPVYGYWVGSCSSGFLWFLSYDAAAQANCNETWSAPLQGAKAGVLTVTISVDSNTWTLNAGCNWTIPNTGDTFHCAVFPY